MYEDRRIKIGDHTIRMRFKGSHFKDTILLIPGFSVPLELWEKTFEHLNGYRIVSFDHLGRGGSDKPRTSYNIDLFVHIMADIIDYLGSDPLHLVGTSMGGAIATDFTCLRPDRVKSLCLICPVGLSNPIPWHAKLYGFPFVGHRILRSFKRNLYNENIRRFDNPSKELKDAVSSQYDKDGCIEAISSTLRNFPWNGLQNDYRYLSRLMIPIHIIWGTDDETIPFNDYEILKKLIPHASSLVIKHGRHNIVYNNAPLIAVSIETFIRNRRKTSSLETLDRE